jgi:hypothetical protein
MVAAFAPLPAAAKTSTEPIVTLTSGWQMQDIAKVPQPGTEIASPAFKADGWYTATVPGTVLTTLVSNHVYPEPLYGENMRPEIIPESLAHTSYWYRTTLSIPKAYKGKHTWLNFDGINYAATIWVNGIQIGTMRGAFARGRFDISSHVQPGKSAILAILVAPQPNPGVTHEHTLRDGVGKNGGITAIDGPPSSPPSAGTGCPPSATATPASGKRSSSPPPAPSKSKIPSSPLTYPSPGSTPLPSPSRPP